MLWRILCLCVLLAFSTGLARGQGRVDQIRQDANTPSASSSSNNSQNNNSKGVDSSDDGWGELLGPLVLYTVASPFWLPHILMDDDLAHPGYFPPYPYPDSFPAYLWQGRWANDVPAAAPDGELPNTRWWSVRLTAENGNDFRGLNRTGVRATIDTASRFGVQSNWNYLYENLSGGRHDDTLLGDTSLTVRFAQHEQIQMYTGLGFRVLTDPCTTNWGVNFLYGLDFFPAKPFVISAQIDGGNVGSAAVFHGRATFGVVKEHYEFFGGYDFMRIGSENVQGPMLGVRFWF